MNNIIQTRMNVIENERWWWWRRRRGWREQNGARQARKKKQSERMRDTNTSQAICTSTHKTKTVEREMRIGKERTFLCIARTADEEEIRAPVHSILYCASQIHLYLQWFPELCVIFLCIRSRICTERISVLNIALLPKLFIGTITSSFKCYCEHCAKYFNYSATNCKIFHSARAKRVQGGRIWTYSARVNK